MPEVYPTPVKKLQENRTSHTNKATSKNPTMELDADIGTSDNQNPWNNSKKPEKRLEEPEMALDIWFYAISTLIGYLMPIPHTGPLA